MINELRNSYDHLIKGIVKSESDELELNKAITHLKRAAYDACEIISLDATKTTHGKITKYSTEIITRSLPEYFSKIYPRLIEIKDEISIERSKNDELFTDQQHLNKYLSLYNELIEFDKVITKAIIGMEELERKIGKEKRKEKWKNIIINIIGGVIAAVITAIILYFSPLNSKNSNTSNTAKDTSKSSVVQGK